MEPEIKDKWSYIWGSPKYSSTALYHLPYKWVTPPSPFLWIWSSKCSNKLRVFTWLLLMDRLNTRNILRRKKHKLENDNFNCILCEGNYEETAYHLFFSCTFSQLCWESIGIFWNYIAIFFDMMQEARQHFQGRFFMEFFIISAWQIWKERNNFIFT